jgi:predicted carbohydrate-binding protein with CBM5 and CBM33 domain
MISLVRYDRGGRAWERFHIRCPASAHGAMMVPGSRTFLCWKDGLTPRGNIVPQNPACAAAVATSGDNSLYNWFSVLRSDGAGRTRGFVSDGQLCSGGNPNFTGFNVARADFPVTHLTSGARLNFKYNKWAAHPGWFYLYITKDSWSPTRPLAWNDLEEQPFLVADHPADTGAVGSVDGNYSGRATCRRARAAATSSTRSGSARTARRPSTAA